MKKFVLILGLLLLVVMVAIAIFLATFDADRYRPLVVHHLEEAIGAPVQLERISLGWQGGIAMQLHGLTIAEPAHSDGEPLLHTDSIRALVELLPLLRKEVRVSSIVLQRPQIRLARDAQGNLNVLGLAAVASPAAASSPTAVGGTPVSLNIASLRIEDGTVHWTDAMTHPATELWGKALEVSVRNIAPGQPMDITIEAAVATDQSNVKLSGRVTLPSSSVPGAVEDLSMTLHELPLDRVLPASPAGQPQLHGILSARFQGSVPTLDPQQLTRVLTGTGEVQLEHGRVTDLNVLRTVFDQLSVLPGLVGTLQARLPEEYQSKLNATETVLQPITLALRIEAGSVQFQTLRVSTDTFTLHGSGVVGLDGTVNAQAVLGVDPTLSAAIIRSIQELRALANSTGELEFPVSIQGKAPQVAVRPDVRYVASKVVVTKAVDWLGKFLEPKEESSSPSSEDQHPDSSQTPDLLGNLLQRALERRAPAQSSQPQ